MSDDVVLEWDVKPLYYEQHAVIRFLLAKGLHANEIHSEMRPVYGD